jgi:hypothetical protein
MYDRADDANTYLRHTVCYWDGQPIYVERVGGDFQMSYYVLPITNLSDLQYADVRDARFNCKQYQLGYMNSAKMGQSLHVTRRPARQVQQGLCDNNTSFAGQVDPYGDRMGMGQAIRDPGFVDMLKGVYPNMEETKARLANKKVQSVAVSPQLAVKRHPQFSNLHFLEYKGREISFSETLEFALPDEFKYLREICAPTGVLRAA